MREVISVHVGQAGVQIGNACCKSRVFFLRLEALLLEWVKFDASAAFFFVFVPSDDSPVVQGNSTQSSTA